MLIATLFTVLEGHLSDANLYNLGLHSEYIQPWLFEGETDKDPYEDEEIDDDAA